MLHLVGMKLPRKGVKINVWTGFRKNLIKKSCMWENSSSSVVYNNWKNEKRYSTYFHFSSHVSRFHSLSWKNSLQKENFSAVTGHLGENCLLRKAWNKEVLCNIIWHIERDYVITWFKIGKLSLINAFRMIIHPFLHSVRLNNPCHLGFQLYH